MPKLGSVRQDRLGDFADSGALPSDGAGACLAVRPQAASGKPRAGYLDCAAREPHRALRAGRRAAPAQLPVGAASVNVRRGKVAGR